MNIDDFKKMLQDLYNKDILTLNTDFDGNEYLWYYDGETNWALSLKDGKMLNDEETKGVLHW